MAITQTFNYTGSIESFTVPDGVFTLTITAVGAGGGSSGAGDRIRGGYGVSMQGDFSVTPGVQLGILVGGRGADAHFYGAGGGGGSFVWLKPGNASTDNILIAAGGGGGASHFWKQGIDAVLVPNGTNANGGGDGGSGGNGGLGGNIYYDYDGGGGGGGAGISTPGGNGANSWVWSGGAGGQAISDGGAGGFHGTAPDPAQVGSGGFGGGGGGAVGGGGGGGGLSGGGGGGGGGGSVNFGVSPINTVGVGINDGQVIITYTPELPVTKMVDINLISNVCCTCFQNNLILKSGNPVSSILKLPLVPGVTGTPITVATVTIDTSFLHDPKIMLNFAINIIIPEGAVFSNLTFNVFKFCFNMSEKIPVGNAWYFKNSSLTETASIFSFLEYDYVTFENKYCTYILEATPYT